MSGLEGALKVSSEGTGRAGEPEDSETRGEMGWEEPSLELVGAS